MDDLRNDPFLSHSNAVGGPNRSPVRSQPEQHRSQPVQQPPTIPPLPPGRGNKPVNPTTTWTEESLIHSQFRPEDFQPEPPPIWYESQNNWNECLQRMDSGNKLIHSEFTGAISKEERAVKETRLQKAADKLYKESDGKLGKPYEQGFTEVEVADLFADWHFPGDNRSWLQGATVDEVGDFAVPKAWQRLWDQQTGPAYPLVDPDAGNFNPRMGKVYQGDLEDNYIVQACFAVGMKGQLIRNVFVDMKYSDPNIGMYMLRFYKHAQWVEVEIDDTLPMDKKDGDPMGCKGEFWPAYPWASLIEKAYAKLHGSYESLAGGGHVEEVMTDLTGGCCSRFHTTDCAGDRLWKYFYELQNCCVWGLSINEKECSKRLIPITRNWASAVYAVTKDHQGIPYIGIMTCAPMSSVKHFPLCDVPMPEGYGVSDGFAWLRVDDFSQLFDAIYECRLVNSDLGVPNMPRGPGMPKPQLSPGYLYNSPWYERMWAYRGDIFSETCPTFIIDVHEPGTEIIMEASATDHRFTDSQNAPPGSRHIQAPILLRFFQCGSEVDIHNGGEIYLVHMSAWGHTRDSTCCVKALGPGRYACVSSMPMKYKAKRMVFRTYSDKVVSVIPHTSPHDLMPINPGMPLDAIPYSLAGFPRIDAYSEKLPMSFDEEEGRGLRRLAPKGPFKGLAKYVKKDDQDGMPHQKVVGRFGGMDAEATISAAEEQDISCSLM